MGGRGKGGGGEGDSKGNGRHDWLSQLPVSFILLCLIFEKKKKKSFSGLSAKLQFGFQ